MLANGIKFIVDNIVNNIFSEKKEWLADKWCIDIAQKTQES